MSSDPKDNESFFRKVVRFVANPTTDWHELNSQVMDPRESEYAKSELKAMIERKRRNDFVRKREFDMLRKIRREGIHAKGLADHPPTSQLDDTLSQPARTDVQAEAVRHKIDAIEKQMVGETSLASRRRLPPYPGRPEGDVPLESAARGASDMAHVPLTLPPIEAAYQTTIPNLSGLSTLDAVERPGFLPTQASGAPGATPEPVPSLAQRLEPLEFDPGELDLSPLVPSKSAPATPELVIPSRDLMRGTTPPVAKPAPAPKTHNPSHRTFADSEAMEVVEAAHDPELDEAVIAFANADFGMSEEILRRLIQEGGARAGHLETWLVLFDFYRATGDQAAFERLALEFVQCFHTSAPAWFSMPQKVAEQVTKEARRSRWGQLSGDGLAPGWRAPKHVEPEDVLRLNSQTLQLPMPWVLDWSDLRTMSPAAAAELCTLFQHWGSQALKMHWLGTPLLMDVLLSATPVGHRDADPVWWMLRLEILRLTNRPDLFDETAIDYCVTYEVSPPSWAPAQCKVQIDDGSGNEVAPLSMISGTSRFMDSRMTDEAPVEVATVSLSGQLVGDISELLERMSSSLGDAHVVSVNCTELIRVDFIAAGDLLNWVIARRGEHRDVTFDDTHRLVALFFGAMGINEQAGVKLRRH